MVRTTGGRVRTTLYLLFVSVACALLILSGYVLDRLPVVPTALSSSYQRGMFAAISWLVRPVDGWSDASIEPVAGGVVGESAP